jgi:hypothetical protein
MQPPSRWTRPAAPRGKCSCSEVRTDIARQLRRCDWWIWPPAYARCRLTILLQARWDFATAPLPDGGIIYAGGTGGTTVEMLQRSMQGALDAAWAGREMPAMSAGRDGCSGCMLSDGRFAVLGGYTNSTPVACRSSCEALTLGGDGHWSPLPQMHDTRAFFACAAVAGCISVAGGGGYVFPRKSAEVYDEVLCRWLRLPHDLPRDGGSLAMGSMLL